jgi:transposase
VRCARRQSAPPSAPGQVLQLDWAERPTRPKIAGREQRVYALVGSLPYSGARSAHVSLELTLESFLEGHVRLFEWLGGSCGSASTATCALWWPSASATSRTRTRLIQDRAMRRGNTGLIRTARKYVVSCLCKYVVS